ncbi:MAG: acyl-CoA thioesterase [Gammaproteobacteria bacterium]|jgi:acyl-CoA thioesterase
MTTGKTSRHHRDDTGMLEALGFVETVSVDRDLARVSLKFRPERHHCNNAGVVQGGFITAWLDCAMSSAVFVKGGRGTTLVSLEIKTAYYAPIYPGTTVMAQGWIERQGSRTAFLEGRVVDEEGNVLAKTTSTASVRTPQATPGSSSTPPQEDVPPCPESSPQ